MRRVTVDSIDEQRDIDFEWRGTLTGTADGVVEFGFDGTARRAFSYSRIGLCVLHPPDFAGRLPRAHATVAGSRAFTRDIGPQLPGEHGLGEPLFPAFTELELVRPDGSGVVLELEGDLFELEDQRNWTDASFKTYSTPLHLGGRHQASPGMRIRQHVRISPIAAAARPARGARAGPADGRDRGGDASSRAAGRPVCRESRPPARRARGRPVAGARPGHLRVDLDLGTAPSTRCWVRPRRRRRSSARGSSSR